MASTSGAMGVNERPAPNQRSNSTLVSATDVIDEVSRATVRILSIGTLLTNRIESKARRAAIATPGTIARSGIRACRAMLEVPHQRHGIQERDCRNAETAHSLYV